MKTLLLYIFILISIISAKAEEKLIRGPKLIFEENKNQWPKQVLFETIEISGLLFTCTFLQMVSLQPKLEYTIKHTL